VSYTRRNPRRDRPVRQGTPHALGRSPMAHWPSAFPGDFSSAAKRFGSDGRAGRSPPTGGRGPTVLYVPPSSGHCDIASRCSWVSSP